MFSSTTTELSIRREKHQRESAQHHGVDGPAASRSAEERGERRDRNREQTEIVPRTLPRKTRIITRGQHQANAALAAARSRRRFSQRRLIEDHARDQRLGNVEQMLDAHRARR